LAGGERERVCDQPSVGRNKRAQVTNAYLIKRPRIGPATLKHLVDDAFGFFPRGAVGVGGDREGGAAADAGLVLLRKVPVSPRELAVELAVAAQVFGAYLFCGWVSQIFVLRLCGHTHTKKKATTPHLCTSMSSQIFTPFRSSPSSGSEPPLIVRMDQLVREGVFHVSFAHEAVLAQEDAQFGRVAAGHGGGTRAAGDGEGEMRGWI
jgi:hypothetical protein